MILDKQKQFSGIQKRTAEISNQYLLKARGSSPRINSPDSHRAATWGSIRAKEWAGAGEWGKEIDFEKYG
jgi:hypothetical protein